MKKLKLTLLDDSVWHSRKQYETVREAEKAVISDIAGGKGVTAKPEGGGSWAWIPSAQIKRVGLVNVE